MVDHARIEAHHFFGLHAQLDMLVVVVELYVGRQRYIGVVEQRAFMLQGRPFAAIGVLLLLPPAPHLFLFFFLLLSLLRRLLGAGRAGHLVVLALFAVAFSVRRGFGGFLLDLFFGRGLRLGFDSY